MPTETREKKHEEKVPKTKPMPQGQEFKEWVEKQPKPPPGDRGNRLPPDPPTDQAAPRESGIAEPQEA